MVSLLARARRRLNRGPDGRTATTAACAAGLAVALLLVAAAVPPVRGPAAAIAGASACASLGAVAWLLGRLRAKIEELSAAVALEGGLRRAGYRLNDLFTDGAAATPSLQLLHLKILRLCRPVRVLELGSGQTTRLVASYVSEADGVYALTLEEDEAWAARFRPQVVGAASDPAAGIHDYRHAPLRQLRFECAGTGHTIDADWYAPPPDVAAALERGGFDYVLVDGPGYERAEIRRNGFARGGVLHLIPGLLGESFVVVFDDAHRSGEARTADAFGAILTACGVVHVRFAVRGIKTQVVYCSPDRAFLRSV